LRADASGPAATVPGMSFTERAAQLTESELDALLRAGIWYANYFALDIAAEAGESHAKAVEERLSYMTLVDALRKLGVLYAVPDELAEHARSAA
jgi:hypothetical protein